MCHTLITMSMKQTYSASGWKSQSWSFTIMIFPKHCFATFHLDIVPVATVQIHQHRKMRTSTQLGLVAAAIDMLTEALTLHISLASRMGPF